jgi:hypothetical protein
MGGRQELTGVGRADAPGVGACCENLGRERATPRSSPRSKFGGAVAESCRQRRGLVAVVRARRV